MGSLAGILVFGVAGGIQATCTWSNNGDISRLELLLEVLKKKKKKITPRGFEEGDRSSSRNQLPSTGRT